MRGSKGTEGREGGDWQMQGTKWATTKKNCGEGREKAGVYEENEIKTNLEQFP